MNCSPQFNTNYMFSSKAIIYFTIIVIVIYGCQSVKVKPDLEIIENNNPYFIDLSSNLNNAKELYLSDFVDSIVYIPLETTPESIIPELSKVIPIDNGYLIATQQDPIYYFDNNGHFIKKIGSIGRGPEEYMMSWFTQFDNVTELIYVFDVVQKRIQVFDIHGVHQKVIRLDDFTTGFHLFGNSILLVFQHHL